MFMKELENKIIEFVQKRDWDQLEHPGMSN